MKDIDRSINSILYGKINSLEFEDVEKKVEVYRVGTTRKYKNFTSCIRDLKDNKNKKIIYVDPGVYSIFHEMGGSNFALSIENETSYSKVNDIVPPNTKIVGIGYVEFDFLPTVDQIGYNASQLLSPLNICGSCTIENISIVAQNCRYCIHDETGSNEQYFGSVKKYKNVRCFKLDAGTKNGKVYGKAHAYACGFTEDMLFKFENCYFEGEWAAFYMHNSDFSFVHSPQITINNCIFKTRKSKGDGSALSLTSFSEKTQQINTFISGSYFSSNLKLDTGSTSKVKNAYNVTLLNCNDVDVVVGNMINQFTPSIYK